MGNSKTLKERIHAYDFAIVELNLFLDTHPCDKEALCLLKMYRDKREQLVALYEQQYGPYVAKVTDVQGDTFSWVDNPWPWDYCKEV